MNISYGLRLKRGSIHEPEKAQQGNSSKGLSISQILAVSAVTIAMYVAPQLSKLDEGEGALGSSISV